MTVGRAESTIRAYGGLFLAEGAVLHELRRVVVLGLRERQRSDGAAVSQAMRELCAELGEAIDFANPDLLAKRNNQVSNVSRSADAEAGDLDAELLAMNDDELLTTTEAAKVLGVGVRRVQQLAAVIGTVETSARGYRFRVDDVEIYRARTTGASDA